MTIKRRFKSLVRADASIMGLVMLLGSGMSTVHAVDSVLASQYYETALMKYHNGDLTSAIIELKNTLQAEPGHLAALTMLVKTYMETENYLSAEATMLMAEKSGADPSLLVLHKAEIYINQLRYKQLLTEIVPEKFKPGLAADIHLYRGFANLQLEELGAALNEYQIATRLEPMKIEPLLGQVKVLLQLGNIDSAKKIAQKATEIESSSVDLWVIKAAIEKTQGNLEQALQFYNQVLLRQPEHFDALLERAGILIELQKDLLAEKDLVLARQLSETNLKAAYLYSLVLARNDRQDESKKVLLDAVAIIDQLDLDIIRQYSQVVLLAGLINFNLGNYDRALEFLQIYRNRHPNELDSYRMIGAIFLNRGKHEQVIDLIKPVVSLKTRDHKILYILAKAYLHNGQNDMAEMILNRLADLNIKHIDIYTLIGQNKLGMGQHEEAIKAFSDALKINSANNDAGVPLSLLLVNLERYTEAIKVVEGLLENDPENLMLLNLLGTTQLKAGFFQQARESFHRCINIDEKYTTAHLNLTKLDIKQNKFQNAEARLQGLVEKYPENLEYLLELSRLYRSRNQNDLALQYLDMAKKVSPDNMGLKIAQIEMNLRLGLPSKALVLAQDIYAQNRENLQVMEILARCFLANKNISKAKGMIQEMSVVAGFNSKQLHKISRLQLKINDASGAIKSLKKAVLGSENYYPARISLSEAELRYGDPVFALNHANYLIKHYSAKAFGYRLLGDFYLKQKKFKPAIENFQTALKKDENTFHLIRLYSAYKAAKADKKALTLVESWLPKHSHDVLAKEILADEYLLAGRYQKAKALYEKLIQNRPNRVDYLNNLAYIYLQLNDEKALSYAEKAQNLAPHVSSINDTYGWVLVQSGQVEKGLRYLRFAYAKSSSEVEINYHIAVALYKQKRYLEARVELKNALAGGKVFNGRKDAEKLLDELNNLD